MVRGARRERLEPRIVGTHLGAVVKVGERQLVEEQRQYRRAGLRGDGRRRISRGRTFHPDRRPRGRGGQAFNHDQRDRRQRQQRAAQPAAEYRRPENKGARQYCRDQPGHGVTNERAFPRLAQHVVDRQLARKAGAKREQRNHRHQRHRNRAAAAGQRPRQVDECREADGQQRQRHQRLARVRGLPLHVVRIGIERRSERIEEERRQREPEPGGQGDASPCGHRVVIR